MMKLRINPLVAKDLKSIKEFIAEDNADKALETVQEIYRQFENIQQFPYIGADLSKRVRDFAFKIKSSPFCKGSIWQNGEFSY